MSEASAKEPRSPLLRRAIWGVALIGVAAAVSITAAACYKPAGSVDLKSLAKGEMAKLSFEAAGSPPPPTAIQGPDGKPVQLADFKGKVVVVNFWATWCGPCKIEMPTVAKLAADYQRKNLTVIALSVDKPEEEAAAKAFIAKHPPLGFYMTPNLKLNYAIKPPVTSMPTTIIYGADGLEKARITAPADWSGKDAKALVDAVLAQG